MARRTGLADITRRADVKWVGALMQGKGSLTVGSGALGQQNVSWGSRTEEPGGNTSPEELVAAAHASCYAMAFSHTLGEAGHPPDSLNVSAVVTFAPIPEGGFRVSSSVLTVAGKVPGIDQAQFEDYAKQGEAGCPISNALRGNVDISVSATLE